MFADLLFTCLRQGLIWSIAFCLVAPGVQSEIVTWVGPQGQKPPLWNAPENWTPNKLPGAGDRVILPAKANPTLNINTVIDEFLVGETGAGRTATITSQDHRLTVNSLTSWDNGVLRGSGVLDLLDTYNFSGVAHFGDWTVGLSGNGTAGNTSFTTAQSLNIGGVLRVGNDTSFKGASSGELVLTGTLNMDAQTGPGDPPGSLASTAIENIQFNHQGTLLANRGKWVITSTTLSATGAKTITGPMGEIEFRGGGQFGLSEAHEFDVGQNSVIRLTGLTRPYELGTVLNVSSNTPVLIKDTKLQGGVFNGGLWAFDAETTAPIEIRKGQWDWRGGTIRSGLTLQPGAQMKIGAQLSNKAMQLEGISDFGGEVSQLRNLTLSTNTTFSGLWTMFNTASLIGRPDARIELSGHLQHSTENISHRSSVNPYLSPVDGVGLISNDGGILDLRAIGSSSASAPYTFMVDEKVGAGAPARTIINGTRDQSITDPNAARLHDTLFAFKDRGGTLELNTDMFLTGTTIIGAKLAETGGTSQLIVTRGTVFLDGVLIGARRLANDTSRENPFQQRIADTFGGRLSFSPALVLNDASTDLVHPTVQIPLSSLQVFSDIEWRRGIIAGRGPFELHSGNLTLTGTSTKRFVRSGDSTAVLSNIGGRIRHGGNAVLELGTNTTLVNGDPSAESNFAIYEFQGDGDIRAMVGAQSVQFNNRGLLSKTFGERISSINVPFNNEGVVNSLDGTLRFGGPVQQIGFADEQKGEIILDGKWRTNGGKIQFGQRNVLKLKKITDLTSFSGRDGFLNSLGAPLIDSSARFSTSGEVIIEPDATMEVDQIDQIPDQNKPQPKLRVDGELKGNKLQIEGGELNVGPDGKVIFPDISLSPGPDGAVRATIEGELVRGPDSDTVPGMQLNGGTLQGTGTIRLPLTMGGSSVMSPGTSPGVLHTDSITWMPGSRYRWEVSDWNGDSGTHFDLVRSSGEININATPDIPMEIDVIPLNDSDAQGNATGWNPGQRSEWLILETAAAITGFSPSSIKVNAPGPVNGEWQVQADEHHLRLVYLPPANPYAEWRNLHFSSENLEVPSKTGDAADFDRDGVPNALEFVQGTDPTDGTSKSSLIIEQTSEGPSIRFQIRENTHPFSVSLEASTSLQNWSQVIREEADGGFGAVGEVMDTIETSSSNESRLIKTRPALDEGKRFFRLSITRKSFP
jgi:hypothetical protein